MGSLQGSVRRMMSPLLSLLLGTLLSTSSSSAEDCCEVRIVSNMGDLDDVYQLKEDLGDQKPEEICFDGCIYTRVNDSHTGEEYCFKNENIGGFLECQAIQVDTTAEDIQSQKANIEAETAELEQEVAKMEELSGSLDNVDTKIDDLTTETSTTSAVVRQARDAPTTCDEIADLVTQLAEANSTQEKLDIVARILNTTITKCTTSDNLLKVKIKIKEVKDKNDEDKIKIKIIIKNKKDKIVENKIKITVLQSQLEIIQRPTKTPEPETTTPSPTPEEEFTTAANFTIESPTLITTPGDDYDTWWRDPCSHNSWWRDP